MWMHCLVVDVNFILSGSVPDAGVGAFMRRAISKANERCASSVLLVWSSAQTYLCRLAQGLADRLPAGSDGSNRGESVGALLQAVRHEEAKVHLDLPALLKVCLRVAPLGAFMHSSLCIGDKFGCFESQMLPAHGAHRQACRPSCKSEESWGSHFVFPLVA